jgi:Domain of unknown function (DUF6438)
MKLGNSAKFRQPIEFGTILAIGFALIGCSRTPQPPPIRKISPSVPTYTPYKSITLERTGCYGECPMYKVTISFDGKVDYEGKNFVKVKGKAQISLTPDRVRTLEREIARSRFFSLQNEYITEQDGCTAVATDQASAIISIVSGKDTKSTHHYLGCTGHADLARLTSFENTIDTVVNSDRWIGKN